VAQLSDEPTAGNYSQVGPSISRMCAIKHGSTSVDVCRWLAQSPHYTLRQLSKYVQRATGNLSKGKERLSVLEVNAGSGFSCESLWSGANCTNADPVTELVQLGECVLGIVGESGRGMKAVVRTRAGGWAARL